MITAVIIIFIIIIHEYYYGGAAAGPPYNVSVTFHRLKNSHNICPQLFSGNTRHCCEVTEIQVFEISI